MKKLLLLLLFVPLISFGQLTSKKLDKMKIKTTYSSNPILKGSSIFLGEFQTKNRPFDKSNISSHIGKNLIESGLKLTNKKENADYIIEANYVTDAIAKKQILGLWLNMIDKDGNNILSWQFERKIAGIILKPQEIGEFLKFIIEENLSDSTISSALRTEIKYGSQDKMTKTSKENAINELKKLKELLDLGLITQEEYDKKAAELKKIILGN